MSMSESTKNDYEALTTGCGFVELKNWSTVTLTGEDRHAFLHNMCTNDIRRLTPGEGCEAFCTDVKGKIVAHLFLFAHEDRLEILTVPEQAGPLIKHLDRYIIREDVQLHDHSGEVCWTLISGTEADALLNQVAEAACQVARCDLFWPPGCLLRSTRTEQSAIEQSLREAGAKPCSASALTTLRIESGLPLFHEDFSEANLPQEVDRNSQAISFNKGCYLGQETIARIDALGHVNQKVVVVKLSGSTVPEGGLELSLAEKPVGQVTSSCWSPRWNAPLALATVRRGANGVGTQLASELGLATVVDPSEKST